MQEKVNQQEMALSFAKPPHMYQIDELYAEFDNAKRALLADFDEYVVLARKKIEDMGRPY